MIWTNIWIYLYQEKDMNEYSNIFVSKKLFKNCTKIIQILYEWIFVWENIQIYEYIHNKILISGDSCDSGKSGDFGKPGDSGGS